MKHMQAIAGLWVSDSTDQAGMVGPACFGYSRRVRGGKLSPSRKSSVVDQCSGATSAMSPFNHWFEFLGARHEKVV